MKIPTWLKIPTWFGIDRQVSVAPPSSRSTQIINVPPKRAFEEEPAIIVEDRNDVERRHDTEAEMILDNPKKHPHSCHCHGHPPLLDIDKVTPSCSTCSSFWFNLLAKLGSNPHILIDHASLPPLFAELVEHNRKANTHTRTKMESL
mmetsp:Transcript_29097/g.62685  ORF Transcript_29097/g.62685 Transcript_29097/m.62685 type:complete len:147 (-) Transcript_29097:131-571(-)